MERQNLFADIREKRPLIFYCDIKFVWVMEAYTDFCTRNERSGLARYNTGILKMRRMRKGFEKGRRPLCSEKENVFRLH
jgi:hypothetical protein